MTYLVLYGNKKYLANFKVFKFQHFFSWKPKLLLALNWDRKMHLFQISYFVLIRRVGQGEKNIPNPYTVRIFYENKNTINLIVIIKNEIRK
jgi:hypothetical protein